MVAQDLGILNATIEIPSDYTRVEEETIFINEAKGCGIMVDYSWNIDGPIYSLADVESQREAIAANLMQNPQILAAGPDQVGSAGAYQIYLEGTDSEGVSSEVVIMRWRGMISAVISSSRSIPRGTKPPKRKSIPLSSPLRATVRRRQRTRCTMALRAASR